MSAHTAWTSRPLAERLLAVMDQKNHWAYPHLTRPGLSRPQLLAHFRHEYLVYVRDFPVLLARVLGHVPFEAARSVRETTEARSVRETTEARSDREHNVTDVRSSLAENLYEEQTGGISRTAPHPELFLRMMEGLGFQRADFAEDDAWLHPAARAYRDFLRDASLAEPWQASVALLTIFVEGSVNERAELAGTFTRAHGEEAVLRHPLVAHYGCAPEAMQLTRAHAAVEGAHRSDAWRMVMDHVDDDSAVASEVVATCERALAAWHRYRDGVASRMHLTRDASAA